MTIKSNLKGPSLQLIFVIDKFYLKEFDKKKQNTYKSDVDAHNPIGD